MIGEFFCRFRGHRIDRRRVWHDGLDFRTNCARCRRSLVKADREWRPFDTDRDLDTRRKPHPNFDKAGA